MKKVILLFKTRRQASVCRMLYNSKLEYAYWPYTSWFATQLKQSLGVKVMPVMVSLPEPCESLVQLKLTYLEGIEEGELVGMIDGDAEQKAQAAYLDAVAVEASKIVRK